MQELVNDIDIVGYYGGMRLIKGLIKVFFEYLNWNIEKTNEKFGEFFINYQNTL